MDEFWLKILDLGITGVVLGIVALLGFKFVVPHWLSRKLEEFRKDLKKEIIEYEVMFGKFHERRVIVIEGLYKKLIKARRTFGALTSEFKVISEGHDLEKVELENFKEAFHAGIELSNYCEFARLYTTRRIDELLDAILKEFIFASSDYRMKLKIGERNSKYEREFGEKAESRYKNFIEPLMDALRADFKAILRYKGGENG